MQTRITSLLVFITFCAIVWLGTSTAQAQSSSTDFHKILQEKAAFDETAFAALKDGQTVVRLLPVQDKREVAVCGLVGLEVPAELFLQSFRDSMTRKSNPAILEIGSFSSTPTLDDFQTLTIENRDLDDLKECVVGDCRLKLSAGMIQRFQKEVDWQAPDYRIQATQLMKIMLLEYVRDYVARGDAALIEYNDKPKEIRLAEEQHALMTASGYVNGFLNKVPHYRKGLPTSELRIVENAIVWSKIKFGLKPVLAINHIIIYKREQETGPQILIASKQIYANHYFNSSLALTAFVNIPGANPGSYLFYENRSRADGLEGAFSSIKRSIVEDKAVDGLTAILESSKMNLTARALSPDESASAPVKRSWRRWKLGGVHVFAWVFLITAFVALFTLGNYGWKRGIIGGAHS
ncbi:MAG: hypothetical protein ABR556_12420 [Pyrinomonadaceae bacterium]